MNKDMFDEFNDIKADEYLIERTKQRALEASGKKNKRIFLKRFSAVLIPLAAVAVILTILFSGIITDNSSMTAKAQDLMQNITPQQVNVSDAVTDNFINSTQFFSIDLFKHSYKSGKNTLVSPTSVYFALGMTANGADATTKTAFENVLGKYGLSTGDLNRAYKAYLTDLEEKRGSTDLNIADSIWFRSEFKPNSMFLQNNADFYNAGARTLNFNDKNSVNFINNWVRDKTNGKIDKIIDNLNDNAVMYLINALYFEAKWQTPFDTTEKAREGTFYCENGSETTATFMRLSDNFDYIKGDKETGVLLPYDDNRFAFLCILPDKGISVSSYVNAMSQQTIPSLLHQSSKTDVCVTIPKFTATADYELNDALKNMGLNIAFDEGKADFSKIGEDNQSLHISDVRHKTFLKIDEIGTQAGAATSVQMQKSIMGENINFNRPFIYAVIDTKTNLPLFLGVMQKP